MGPVMVWGVYWCGAYFGMGLDWRGTCNPMKPVLVWGRITIEPVLVWDLYGYGTGLGMGVPCIWYSSPPAISIAIPLPMEISTGLQFMYLAIGFTLKNSLKLIHRPIV